MLYPYHLSDVMVKGLRITPFAYYISVMMDIMQQEKSYDALPNFTAADCMSFYHFLTFELDKIIVIVQSDIIKSILCKNGMMIIIQIWTLKGLCVLPAIYLLQA